MGIRHHQQMAGVIGKFIEQDEGSPPAPQDEIVTILLLTGEHAEDTSLSDLILRLQDVFHPPWGPEMLHVMAPFPSGFNANSQPMNTIHDD
jgi:hypothetical protein